MHGEAGNTSKHGKRVAWDGSKHGKAGKRATARDVTSGLKSLVFITSASQKGRVHVSSCRAEVMSVQL